MFTAQRSLTELSHGFSRSSQRRSSRFLKIPNSAVRFVVIALAIGFPIAMLLSWVYEFTPEGVVRTEDLDPVQARSVQRTSARMLDFIIIGALLLVIAMLIVGRLPFYRQTGESISQKGVTVLPFENLSSEKENAFFADGVQDEILNDLAKVADLRVISHTSVMRYKTGVERNLHDIAKALGVSHVVEGSVQRSGGRVRVNAQLIDARNDMHIWGEHYDRDLADVFAIQSEIAKAIADHLQAKLSPQEKARVEEVPTGNIEAYAFYLRANQIDLGPEALLEDYKTAEQLYRQAISLDPNFAVAHARLASVCAAVSHYYHPTEAWRTKARAEAEIALRLQPNLAEARVALGQCIYWMDQDYDRALQQFEIASRLSPSNGDIGRFIAAIECREGKWEQSLETYERVVRIDPLPNTVRELVFTNAVMRRWREAAQWAERLGALAPASAVLKTQRGYVNFWWKGDTRLLKSLLNEVPARVDPDGGVTSCRWDAAMIERDFAGAQTALETSSVTEFSYMIAGTTPKSFLQGCVHVAQGDQAEAQRSFEIARPAFEKAVEEAPLDAIRHAALGLFYAFAGRKDDAIREGRRAIELKPESNDAVDGVISNCYLALIYARVGANDLAIPLIERLLETPGAVDSADYSITINDLKYRWEWDPIRNDPRFQKLIAEKAP